MALKQITPELENIGAAIKDARVRKGYSRRQFSDLIDCSEAHIKFIEDRTRLPSREMWIRIKDALELADIDTTLLRPLTRARRSVADAAYRSFGNKRRMNRSVEKPILSIPISENLLRTLVDAAVEAERLKQKGESIPALCELIKKCTGQ